MIESGSRMCGVITLISVTAVDLVFICPDEFPAGTVRRTASINNILQSVNHRNSFLKIRHHSQISFLKAFSHELKREHCKSSETIRTLKVICVDHR